MAATVPHLDLSTSQEGDRVTLSVRGEIDLTTAGELREAALHAVVFGPRHLDLDLTGVTFCDSSGVQALVTMKRRADLAGVVLSLAPSRPVARVLAITGLDQFLDAPPTHVPRQR